MDSIVINIGRDFGRYPAGRLAKDGPYSGQAFRENFIIPALQKAHTKIVVQFDDARGLSSSFLEEVFGGLIRAGFKSEDILSRIEMQSQDSSLIEEIKEYIKEQASR